MNSEFYKKTVRKIASSEKLSNAVISLNKAITLITYISYPCVLLVLFIADKKLFFKCFAIPCVGFVFVTVLRKLIDKKRPYELFEFSPVISKKSKGESFPSRHIFSVFIIAFTYMYFYLPLGIVFVFFGILLAIIRVVGGVHFISDVFVGILIAAVCGISGYFIL